MKIGLISNPRSRANRKSGGAVARVRPGADILTASPHDHDRLAADLTRFARAGVGLIAIDGGDGTVRDIVTDIHLAYGDDWPLFALLPSGKTNVIAGQVGHFGPGYKGWQNLLAARDQGRLGAQVSLCPALEVSWPGRVESVRRGFLLGCAAFSDGIRMANETIHPMGFFKGLAVALTILGVLRRNLSGGENGAGEAGEVLVDGARVNGARHFVTMASTLDRLTLGLRPFRQRGEGDINWLDIAAPPQSVLRGCLMLALGRHRDWMEPAGYASGCARMLDLHFDQPFTLDGELYDPHGHIRVAASRPIRFLRG